MAVLAITDYVLTGAGKAGLYVQFRDNVTPTTKFTTVVPTDGNGQFNFNGSSPPPPADYSVYTSPLVGAGEVWNLYDSHFRVAYTRGDDAILNTLYAAPGATARPFWLLDGGVAGTMFDLGGVTTHVRKYGAVADGVIIADAAIQVGQAILTSPSNALVGAAIGMAVGVAGAGAAGANFVATILSVQGNGQVTLNATAGTTVVGARAAFGTDNTAALNTALNDYLNWGKLVWSRGIYCVTGTLTPTGDGFSRHQMEGAGLAGSAVEGTLLLQFTDNIPIWKFRSDNVIHSIGWRGMSSDYLNYQGTANTLAFNVMFATNGGAACSYFHWTAEEITFAKGNVGMGFDQTAGRTLSLWNCDFRDVMITHVSRSYLYISSPIVTGNPNLLFRHLYCSNTNGPVPGAGDAIFVTATELEIDGLDLEGWQGTRLFNCFGGANVTLRKVHIENGIATANAAFQISNRCVLTIDDISFTHNYNGAFGNVWVFNATSFARMRLTGLNMNPTNAGGNNIYLVTCDATSPVTVDGYTQSGLMAGLTHPNTGNGQITQVQEQNMVQAVAYAATVTPDPSIAAIIAIGALTGPITIANVVRPYLGQLMTLIFLQDATGARLVTWGAAYKTVWQATGIANSISSITFRYDGTSWQMVAGQVSMDSLGYLRVPTGIGFGGGGPNGTNSINGPSPWTLQASGVLAASIAAAPNMQMYGKLYFGDLAGGGIQSTGGLWHSTGVPANGNGANNDYTFSDNGHFYFRTGGVWVDLTAAANSQSTPANPALTASLVGVMMGVAGAFTPVRTGQVHITISGDMFNSVVADGVTAQIRTGTGGAPANGAALTGTARGNPVAYTAAVAATKSPFSITVIVTGLALGTAIWIDLAVAAVTGGNASVENLTVTAVEI